MLGLPRDCWLGKTKGEKAMKTFWMVWVEGKPSPTMRHDTKFAAAQEAERLARRENLPVFLMEAISYCAQGPIVWTAVGE